MFKINLENLVKTKIYISKEFHIQPSEIDKLPYYEYEMYLEQMNLIAKQQEEYESMKSSMNPSKMMNNNNMTPKMPTVNMPKMPTVNIPKL